jgi:hypothetical protein
VNTATATGFVVTIPTPNQNRATIDKIQSGGMRENPDTRTFVALVFPFYDEESFRNQLAERGLDGLWGDAAAWYPASFDAHYAFTPTIFTHEDAAKRTVEEARARARVGAEVTGGRANFGMIDQHRIEDASTLQVQKDFRVRVREAKLRAQLSDDERAVRRAQEARDRREKELEALGAAKPVRTPSGSELRTIDHVQQDRRADGTLRYPARKAAHGRTVTAGWKDSLEAAHRDWEEKTGLKWETGEPLNAPEPVPVGQTEGSRL